MHSPIRTRHAVRKATLAAQGVAMVLLLGGGVMAYTGLPGLAPGQPEPIPLPEDAPDQDDNADTQHTSPQYTPVVDPETVDGNLNMVANSPEPPAEPTDEQAEEILPTETATVDIRYVGSIKIGGRAAAFLNIDGVTKLLRPGGPSFEGVRLVRVNEKEVVIVVDDGPEQTIEKTVREGSGVSVIAGGAPKPTETSTDAEENFSSVKFTPDMSREERRALILERGRKQRERWERERGQNGGPMK